MRATKPDNISSKNQLFLSVFGKITKQLWQNISFFLLCCHSAKFHHKRKTLMVMDMILGRDLEFNFFKGKSLTE
jgi:hypothetical protein